jgi:DNA-binding response OmpR family regulator
MSNYPRILCVDDDKDTCEMIRMMLWQADYRCSVKSAFTIEEALNYIETESFDLYILDYRMPNMTGIDLCSLIRKTDKQTPIMFFTAMARDIDRKSATIAGANEYLIKPNDLDRLVETIKDLLCQSALDTLNRKVA